MSSIKETIKAEIERLYDGEAPKHDQQCEFEDGYFTGIATISKFIDSLPEEKPSEDLKNTAQHIAIETLSDTKFMTTTMVYVLGKLQDIFIAGAEWQREKMELDGIVTLTESDFDAEKEKASEWGYNLCKEQMMKDAVEGEIVKDITNKLAVTAKNINLDGFKFGDKVKIIIVKQ